LFSLNDDSKNSHDKIITALEEMNLLDTKDLKVKKISGGQKQRLALARATINHPKVLLLDEPTGNLDSKNTKMIMEYILKLKQRDMTIIIITHDNRVMEYADIIYELENKALNLIKGKTDYSSEISTKTNENISSENSRYKKKKFLYTLTSLKTNIKDLIINNVPVMIILLTFILIYNIFVSSSFESLNTLFSGVSDKTIILDLSQFKDKVMKEFGDKGIETSVDGERIGFTENDINEIKKFPSVDKVLTLNTSVFALYDKDKMMLNKIISKDDLPAKVKESPSFTRTDIGIALHFESMPTPYDYVDNYNKRNLSLMFGTFPHDNSDDILIPDVYAYKIAEDLNSNDKIDQIVGNKIILDVMDFDGNKKNKEYIISGVYSTNYQNKIQPEMVIYVNYIDDCFLEFYNTREKYLSQKAKIESTNTQTAEYHRKIYESFESYQKALGTGYSELIITMKNGGNMKAISEKLTDMFPKIKQLSQYDIKSGEFSYIYNRTILIFAIGFIVIALLLGIIIAFMNKAYINKRSKEMAILYSLGYSKKSVAIIILLESLFVIVIDVSLVFLIVFILNSVYLRYSTNYNLFTNIFSFNNIISVILLILVIMLVSVIWSLNGIKKKKLRNYLEG
jgi:energy-coupling factor transporter ATP-binding protein EcfA2